MNNMENVKLDFNIKISRLFKVYCIDKKIYLTKEWNDIMRKVLFHKFRKWLKKHRYGIYQELEKKGKLGIPDLMEITKNGIVTEHEEFCSLIKTSNMFMLSSIILYN